MAPGVSRRAPEPRVVGYLGDYFTAINRHSYRRFAVLLGPRMRQTLPAPAFYAGYRTTTDSAARLTGLSPAGGGQVEADVSFTSHQAPGASPSRSGCTRWRIALVLAPQHGRLVLEPPPPAITPPTRPVSTAPGRFPEVTGQREVHTTAGLRHGSPRTCWARKASTVSYQTTALPGPRIQWFSSG